MNQFRPDSFGLIDEELALLRGRDEILGGVAAAPTYNRLTWNFTNGDGEVAYVTNYNIKDMNQDGFVDEADAAILYPQGHGDAWGQMLTAIGKYYQLLRHPDYTWSPRAEPIGVAGAPVVVDYYDERRFHHRRRRPKRGWARDRRPRLPQAILRRSRQPGICGHPHRRI